MATGESPRAALAAPVEAGTAGAPELAPLEVRKISAHKEAYLPLLLDADPSEQMIARYLNDGELYALKINGQTASVAIVLQKDAQTCELCNLVTAPEFRHKGYAGRLVKHLFKLYQPRCKTMEVGTSPANIGFYEQFGFIPAYDPRPVLQAHLPERPSRTPFEQSRH